MYDVIIIGGGPAGISASLYTIRANLKTLVIYQENSNVKKSDKIENYYGFNNGIDGKKLYEDGIEQARNLGVELKKEEVVNIKFNENKEQQFEVITSKENYDAKTIILATGSKKVKPSIKGIEEFEGKGISFCAICDGFFYKNKNVAIIGNGDYAISETNELLNIANNIMILTNGKKAPELRNDDITINTKEIEQITGNKKVEEIKFKDGTSIPIDGIFIAEGVAGSTDFAKKLGIILKNDIIQVNENMETNIKGIYACRRLRRRTIANIKGSV